MNQRAPLPDPIDGGPFTVAQAMAAGVSRSRLRAGDLASPFHGVRSPQRPASLIGRAYAYAPKLLHGRFFSHTTAAVLLKMRMPTGFDEDVLHVSSVAPRRAPRGAGIVGHQVSIAPALVSNSRLTVASPVDTWVALGASLPLVDLVVMGDGLVRRRDPSASLQELRARIDAHGGERGSAALREAIEQMRAGTDSAPETRLRLMLTSAGLSEPEVNGVVATSRGPFHADLLFRSEGVVVEYDGEQHRTDDRQYAIDVDRLEAIGARWRIVRVDKRLLRRPDEVVSRVRSALAGS
ncbi:endonuclease domain-containing protein [Naasia lichenicola]|uniref:DUF559 domain-containing protein n=1 Tax=Naasia lichenicola TaxID=2565933 RepID=A0A4S4FHV6_9MICO|nr:hypothetical protein [Naasia lichenicola]THG29681.1 hypothetical protein E6C64_13510 [Naasia lichenicola]